MNSSNSHRATLSNRKLKAEASTMTESKRARFLKTYERQNYSLPDNIMFYITKNPTSAALYQKMIQTCKDFFVKNPIIVISVLDYTCDEWFVNDRRFDFDSLTSKVWITSEFHVQPDDSINNKAVNQNIASSITPKIFRCDVKDLTLVDQIISFTDLCLLVQRAEVFALFNVTVKEDDGSIVGIEKIVDVSVNAKEIEFNEPPIAYFTTKVMKKLVEIPSICKLDSFVLTGIPEAFDIEAFYAYMKKNQRTKFWLCFDDSISDADQNRLEEIVDEILATIKFNYRPPNIRFPGMSHEKVLKLYSIWSKTKLQLE